MGCFICISFTHTFVNVVINHTGVLVFEKREGGGGYSCYNVGMENFVFKERGTRTVNLDRLVSLKTIMGEKPTRRVIQQMDPFSFMSFVTSFSNLCLHNDIIQNVTITERLFLC